MPRPPVRAAATAYQLLAGTAEWPPCVSISALTTVDTNSSSSSSNTSGRASTSRSTAAWSIYDAEDDYPVFCIAAAMKTVADPGSLGIVLGGSGNGEQVAANKVPGARCALAWS